MSRLWDCKFRSRKQFDFQNRDNKHSTPDLQLGIPIARLLVDKFQGYMELGR